MARKPVLNFSHSFSHNIWKIHAYETAPYLVLEIRNQEELQVGFTIVNLSDGGIIAEDIKLEESWWVSVADITREQIVFYTFDADHNPDVKQYIGYDVSSLKQVWCKKKDEIKKLPSEGQERNNVIEIPFHYQPGSEYFKTVETFIRQRNEESLVRGVNYLERDNEVFISYFLESDQKLVNKLLVINREGEELLAENLGVFNNGISDNTFFIINNTLIFVKGVTDFFMYDLSS